MNRRSLMLGSVLAAVGGVLGVKVQPVESGYAARLASGDHPAWWKDGKDRYITAIDLDV